MAQNFRKKLYPNYKKKKRRIDPRDVAPEVGHQQEVDKRQAVQDADMNEGNYLQMSDKDIEELTVIQNQQRDALSNLPRDEAIKKVIESTERNTKERADRLGEIAKQMGEDSLGYGLMALQKYGEAIDWTNDQVNLRNSLPFLRGVETPIDVLLDYSYKDLRDNIAGGIGNVVGATTGSETANTVAETGAQILLPDAIDFATGGVGYLDNIGRAALKLRKADGKFINDAVNFADNLVFQIRQKLGGEVSLELAGNGMRINKNNVADTFYQAKGVKGSKNPNQMELKLERFMSNSYQRNVLTKMNDFGMGDGTFRMKAYNANKAKFSKTNKPREMLESYLSPDRLKGNFEGYKKFNKGSWEYKWGTFLKAKGYDLKQGIQAHHINPLFDSIHLFYNVKFNSKEYWSLMETLVNKNARTGAIQLTTQKGDEINNLMMTLGQAKDASTPHGIAHKFYNNFTPDFFSKSEMKKINTVPGYRKKKAKRWAALVNKSEEIILEAHKQWSLLNPETAKDIPFNELIERLSNLDARGYNKLFDPKYQLPDMNSIIKEIAADKGLKQIWQKAEPTEDIAKTAKWERHRKDVEIKKETKAIDKPKPVNPDQTELPGL
tara:strand:+ start:203 stop:2023 length:1821 start_codon:yes stop_codon:yes gene_type:complete